MLRGYGATALSGHRVLGTPIGTPGFITAFVDDAVAAALAAVPLLDSLLLQPNPHSASALGVYAPDERACLIRSCLHSRVRHLSASLPPESIVPQLRRYHSALLSAYLSPLAPSLAPSAHLPLVDPHSLACLS